METKLARRSRSMSEDQVYEFGVTGAEPRPIYHSSQMLWRPERVTVRFSRHQGDQGGWSNWHIRVTASGPKLLKSGAPSPTQTHTDSFADTNREWHAVVAEATEMRDA